MRPSRKGRCRGRPSGLRSPEGAARGGGSRTGWRRGTASDLSAADVLRIRGAGAGDPSEGNGGSPLAVSPPGTGPSPNPAPSGPNCVLKAQEVERPRGKAEAVWSPPSGFLGTTVHPRSHLGDISGHRGRRFWGCRRPGVVGDAPPSVTFR